MKHVFLLTNETKESDLIKVADSYRGSELIILIVPEHRTIAGSLERELHKLKTRAKRLAAALNARGIKSRALVEWGSSGEALKNCLVRESALPCTAADLKQIS